MAATTPGKQPEHMYNLSRNQCSGIIKLRSRMIPAKANHKNQYNDTICRFCEEEEETQSTCSKTAKKYPWRESTTSATTMRSQMQTPKRPKNYATSLQRTPPPPPPPPPPPLLELIASHLADVTTTQPICNISLSLQYNRGYSQDICNPRTVRVVHLRDANPRAILVLSIETDAQQ